MTPMEELENLRRIQDLEDKAAGRQGMTHATSSGSSDPGAPEQLARGAIYAGQRAQAGIGELLPNFITKPLQQMGLHPTPEQLQQSKNYVENTGPLSTAGQMAGDTALFAMPSSVLTKSAAALKGIPRAVMSIADNAALNAAMSPPDERGTGALIGAGSGVLGNTMARLMGGPVRTAITPEAQTLMDSGVKLTPGQMITNKNSSVLPRTIRSIEDSLQSKPLVGDPIKSRMRDSALSYNTAEINQALAPINGKIQGTGDSAIHSAFDKISDTYEDVLPHISIPSNKIAPAITTAQHMIDQQVPLLSPAYNAKLQNFIDVQLTPFANAGSGAGGATAYDVTGKLAKQVDSKMSEAARKYTTKGGAEGEEFSKAMTILRNQWQDAMVGATPEAKDVLAAANKARANIAPLQDAVEKSNTGVFTPGQVRRQALATDHPVTPLTNAGLEVLPSTVGDSGTAGRVAMDKLFSNSHNPGERASGGMLKSLLGAGLTGGAYTDMGSKYMTKGIHPLIDMLRRGTTNPDLTEEMIRQLTGQGARSGFNTMNQ